MLIPLYLHKGFTLIELLVVISVVGILVATVLVLVDPVEIIRRANDAKRINAILSLSKAMKQTYEVNGQAFLPCHACGEAGVFNNWQTLALVNKGAIKAPISVPSSTNNCTYNVQGNICYDTDGQYYATIWTTLESKQYMNKYSCSASTQVAVVAWSTGSNNDIGGCCTAKSMNPLFPVMYGPSTCFGTVNQL